MNFINKRVKSTFSTLKDFTNIHFFNQNNKKKINYIITTITTKKLGIT